MKRVLRTQRDDFGQVDYAQVSSLAKSIRRFEFVFDTFDDPLLYPSKDADASVASNFFFFTTAIDHRTHPLAGKYAGIVRGELLSGAELMWAQAKKRFDEDPGFFTPERMANVSAEDIVELFRVHEPEIVDIAGPEERALLLRDCGRRLQQDFGGSALKLISLSEGSLVRTDGRGLLELLSRFRAFEDPLSKKSFLLVKFLERRGFLQVKDPANLHVPVDNILQRLSLRMGIVEIAHQDLERKIRLGIPVTPLEERGLRELTMQAFDEVAKACEIRATYLDDLLWEFGRVHCRLPIPSCDGIPDEDLRRPYRIIASGPVGECPFGAGCRGYLNPVQWQLKEPKFETTHY